MSVPYNPQRIGMLFNEVPKQNFAPIDCEAVEAEEVEYDEPETDDDAE